VFSFYYLQEKKFIDRVYLQKTYQQAAWGGSEYLNSAITQG
jgi:hypothetical protein